MLRQSGLEAVRGRGYSSTTEQRSFVVTDPGLAPRVASFLEAGSRGRPASTDEAAGGQSAAVGIVRAERSRPAVGRRQWPLGAGDSCETRPSTRPRRHCRCLFAGRTARIHGDSKTVSGVLLRRGFESPPLRSRTHRSARLPLWGGQLACVRPARADLLAVDDPARSAKPQEPARRLRRAVGDPAGDVSSPSRSRISQLVLRSDGLEHRRVGTRVSATPGSGRRQRRLAGRGRRGRVCRACLPCGSPVRPSLTRGRPGVLLRWPR